MNDSPSSTAAPGTAVPPPPNLDEFLGAPARPLWQRRGVMIAGVALLLVAILLLSRCFAGSAEAGYATEEVRRGDLTVTISATGNLLPTNQVEIGSEQSGLITDVFVDNNDQVTKGQPLARLDTSRLRDTIIQNEAALAAAQAQVAQANATAVQARANLARLEQVWRVSGHKVPSLVELDTGRAEHQRAIAGVRAAQAQVTQARAVLSSSQTNLSKATIYSPVTGVVLSRQVDPGQTVAASLSAPVLFVIAEDLGAMKLEVKVDEADVGQVKAGQRATFTVDAFPGRSFPAQILRVDVGANASGSGASASSSTASTVVAYTAVLSVQNPQMILRPGMTATAEIVTSERSKVLLVPNAALRYSPEREAAQAARQGSGGVTKVLVPQRGGRGGRGGGAQRQTTIGRGSQQTVYVLGEDGEPGPIRVTVGETNGSDTEVTSTELREGMKVITGRLASGESAPSKAGAGGTGQGRSGRRSGGADGATPTQPGATPPANGR
ncbi:MAG: HlyD family secretion protein [Sphingomonadales bacterium]|nr:HlyD family secretion protein [Sphingomonadales bacterium]